MKQEKGQSKGIITAVGGCLFILLLGVYYFSYAGVPISDDEQQFASMAQNIALRGEFTTPQLYGNNRIQGEFSNPGLVHSFIGVPVVRLVNLTHLGSLQALFLLTPVYTALTAVLVFLICLKSGYSMKTGLVTSLVFGLITQAWPYSQTFFREPLAMLLVTGTWLALTYALEEDISPPKRILAWVVVVVTFVGALLTKIILLSILPAFLYLVWVSKKGTLRRGITRRQVGTIALILLLAIGVILIINQLLPEGTSTRLSKNFFRHLWRYRRGLHFDEIPQAILGMLFSPSKGMLVYMPIFLLLPGVGFRTNKEARQRLAFAGLALAGMLVSQGGGYGTEWWNTSWGTRFLVPILPLLVFPLGALVEKAPGKSEVWYKIIFWFFTCLTFLIQLGAVLVSTPTYMEELYIGLNIPDLAFVIWSPKQAPLYKHWELLLRGETAQPALFRLYTSNLVLAVGLTILFLGMISAAVLLLKRIIKTRKVYSLWTISLLVLSLAVIPILMLNAYQEEYRYSHTREDITEAYEYVISEAEEEDIILVYSYLKPSWYYFLNFYRGDNLWYSLSRTYPTGFTASTTRLIDELDQTPVRVWLVAESNVDEPLAPFAEFYLSMAGALQYDTVFTTEDGYYRVRVVLYELGE
jgi:hypothetical protein